MANIENHIRQKPDGMLYNPYDLLNASYMKVRTWTNESTQKRDIQKIEVTRVAIVHIFDECDIDSDIYS